MMARGVGEDIVVDQMWKAKIRIANHGIKEEKKNDKNYSLIFTIIKKFSEFCYRFLNGEKKL